MMMKSIYIKIAAIILTVIILSSCGKLEFFNNQIDNVDNPSVGIEFEGVPAGEQIQVERRAQDMSFMIKANVNWVASVADEDAAKWCSVSPVSSWGNSRLLVRLKYNDGAKTRRATIRVTYTDKVYDEFDIIQSGASLLEKTTMTTSKFKSSTKVTVVAIDDWSTEVRYDEAAGGGSSWCLLDKTSGGVGVSEVLVTTTPNATDSDRTAYIDVQCGGAKETITVTQRGVVEAFVAVIDESADTLCVKWNKLLGATGYKISATNIPETITVDTSMTSYNLLPVSGNLFASYVGLTDVKVEALTDDNTVDIKTTPVGVHTLYDKNSGDGSDESRAFVVSVRRHFGNVKKNTSSFFKQTADINLSGFDDDKIAANGNFTPIAAFAGTYDGGGKKIENLAITSTTAKTAPFLILKGASASSRTVLKSINMVNPKIVTTGNSFTSALVGEAQANFQIIGCNVIGGSVFGSVANTMGALVASTPASGITADDIIENCSNQGCSVTSGVANVGGVIGTCSVAVEGCYNTASVTGAWHVGGIAGTIYNGAKIKQCYNKGAIASTNEAGNMATGGIGGRAYGTAALIVTIEECFNNGSISGVNKKTEVQGVGGVLGAFTGAYAYINNCYNSGSITTNSETLSVTGGIVGSININAVSPNKLITNSYSVGTIAFGYGIVGYRQYNKAGQEISGCYFLDSSAKGGSATLTTGFTSLDNAKMQELTNYQNWNSSLWQNGSGAYLYPQLKNNLH